MVSKKEVINDINGKNVIYGEYIYKTRKTNEIFSVIERCNYYINNEKPYKVKFKDTGNEYDRTMYAIRYGELGDSNRLIGKIFDTEKSGKFKVLEKTDIVTGSHPEKLYKIQFLNTGTIMNVPQKRIIDRNIRDPYRKNKYTYGIGYMGTLPEGINTQDKIYEILYNKWRNMLRRCYGTESSQYKTYGGSGIYVCERWHCFANYYNDVFYIQGFSEEGLLNGTIELDKDIKCKQLNIYPKVYSPETCIFISHKLNSMVANNSNFDVNLVKTASPLILPTPQTINKIASQPLITFMNK